MEVGGEIFISCLGIRVDTGAGSRLPGHLDKARKLWLPPGSRGISLSG